MRARYGCMMVLTHLISSNLNSIVQTSKYSKFNTFCFLGGDMLRLSYDYMYIYILNRCIYS